MKKGECRAALKKIGKLEHLMLGDLDEPMLIAAMGFVLFPDQWRMFHKRWMATGGVA